MAAHSFRGTNSGQDARFRDKAKLALRRIKLAAPPEYHVPIDMSKVNRSIVEKWVADSIRENMGGLEDEVLCNLVMALLDNKPPSAVELHYQIREMLGKSTTQFVKDLWVLLADAQSQPTGMPSALIEAKRRELQAAQQQQTLQALAIHASLASGTAPINSGTVTLGAGPMAAALASSTAAPGATNPALSAALASAKARAQAAAARISAQLAVSGATKPAVADAATSSTKLATPVGSEVASSTSEVLSRTSAVKPALSSASDSAITSGQARDESPQVPRRADRYGRRSDERRSDRSRDDDRRRSDERRSDRSRDEDRRRSDERRSDRSRDDDRRRSDERRSDRSRDDDRRRSDERRSDRSRDEDRRRGDDLFSDHRL